MKILLFFLFFIYSCNILDESISNKRFSFSDIDKREDIDFLYFFNNKSEAYFIIEGYLFYINQSHEFKKATDLYTRINGIIKIQEYKNVLLILKSDIIEKNLENKKKSQNLYFLKKNNNKLNFEANYFIEVDRTMFVEDFMVFNNDLYIINKLGLKTNLYKFQGSLNENIEMNFTFRSKNLYTFFDSIYQVTELNLKANSAYIELGIYDFSYRPISFIIEDTFFYVLFNNGEKKTIDSF